MSDIASLAKDIKLLILDVDGVCTDGGLYYAEQGEIIKRFNVQDGLGIKLLISAGVEVALITAKASKAVEKRMRPLGVKYLYQGYENKLTAYHDLLQTTHLTDEEVAYVGDDLPDLCLIRRVRLGITVPNGHELVKSHAKLITQRTGGNGAVREVCELILKAQNKFNDILQTYS
ncbi:MAG: phenylphosphate carboxylase subunit delta [Gammaproteobacteria bacterium RIFCSPHIGHO2_12_FULL_35_23]|nr:MAG: phenylphosphate carboxylase subunit delta [Gammaproteobacteria bacterium RIFCSPHIGHO2_12_FULL_35_23]